MADPGFPRGGGANSPGEIERIWAPRGGGARPSRPPLDPPLKLSALWLFTGVQTTLTAGVYGCVPFVHN